MKKLHKWRVNTQDKQEGESKAKRGKKRKREMMMVMMMATRVGDDYGDWGNADKRECG